MKILVACKRVADPDQRPRVRADGASIETDGVPFVLNPFDAISLEEALRIREQAAAAVEVLAVGIGGAEYDDVLRTALAMGADRALWIECAARLDPWNVARLLQALVHREAPDVVLLGKQAIDDDASQTGQFLAALLGWPQATFASRIELLGGTDPNGSDAIGVVRVAQTDAGLETIRVSLPAVITADLRLNEPRYASLPAIMRARKKAIEHVTSSELGVAVEPRVEIVRLESVTSAARACVRVADVAELVERLRGEAKVI